MFIMFKLIKRANGYLRIALIVLLALLLPLFILVAAIRGYMASHEKKKRQQTQTVLVPIEVPLGKRR